MTSVVVTIVDCITLKSRQLILTGTMGDAFLRWSDKTYFITINCGFFEFKEPFVASFKKEN